jgi:hypothetical protein
MAMQERQGGARPGVAGRRTAGQARIGEAWSEEAWPGLDRQAWLGAAALGGTSPGVVRRGKAGMDQQSEE